MPARGPCRDRFEAKFLPEPMSGCWLWEAGTNEHGYGTFFWDAAKPRRKAHRAAWELYRGPISDDVDLLHKCDTPACVNPDHLRPGTHLANVQDMVAKRRHIFGHRHKLSKLTTAQALSILNDSRTHSAIADDYGVNQSQVSRIKAGKRWKVALEGAAA